MGEAKQKYSSPHWSPNCVVLEFSVRPAVFHSNFLTVFVEYLKIPEMIDFRPSWIQVLSNFPRIPLTQTALASSVPGFILRRILPQRRCSLARPGPRALPGGWAGQPPLTSRPGSGGWWLPREGGLRVGGGRPAAGGLVQPAALPFPAWKGGLDDVSLIGQARSLRARSPNRHSGSLRVGGPWFSQASGHRPCVTSRPRAPSRAPRSLRRVQARPR